jgi:thiol:disulfide interchange protein
MRHARHRIQRALLGAILIPAALLGSSCRSSPQTATKMVAEAVSRARAEHKVVLIEFGASWCTWCRKFEAFVQSPDVGPIVASHYRIVNLTVREHEDKKTLDTPGGMDVLTAYGGEEAGLPFYVFLDGSGRKIADSNAMPDGTNIGFPASALEVDAFVRLIDRTASLAPDDRAKVLAYLRRGI